MDYPHWIRIFRGTPTSGGTQDDEGVWTDDVGLDDVEEVYDGPADVQDGGKTVERDNLGSPEPVSNAVAFLKKEKEINLIKVGDGAEITWEDGSKDMADVTKIRKFDGTVFLRRL